MVPIPVTASNDSYGNRAFDDASGKTSPASDTGPNPYTTVPSAPPDDAQYASGAVDDDSDYQPTDKYVSLEDTRVDPEEPAAHEVIKPKPTPHEVEPVKRVRQPIPTPRFK